MEEGVDIPMCNMVIRFDVKDLHYRSFVQCKGRARAKTGEFILLASETERYKVQKNMHTYKDIEETLYKVWPFSLFAHYLRYQLGSLK